MFQFFSEYLTIGDVLMEDMKYSLPKNLEKLCSLLSDNGFKSYIAGGAVRDFLLERNPVDYDVATDAKPEEVMKILEKNQIKGVDTNAKYGTILAVMGSEEVYEITTFRTEGPYSDGRRPDAVTFSSEEEDAQRRDFTINGLFFDSQVEKVIDYVNGQEDLNKKVVRFIGDAEARIQEDHLRILRYVRFLHTLGFDGDEASGEAVKKNAELIKGVSGERIRDEINKAFVVPRPDNFIRLLDEYELLEILLPDVKALQGVVQGKRYHSEGDAYVHTLLALESLPDEAELNLVWATMFHDIGKKETQDIKGENNEIITFYKHDRVSFKLSREILKKFRFSNSDSEEILFAIKKHMTLPHIDEMREAKQINLVRHKHFPLLFELFKADMTAAVPDDPVRRKKDYEKIAYIEDLYHNERDTDYPPLITGKDLIELGMKPGPKFTKILEEVYHLQLEKKLKTREEAMEYVESNK